MPKTKTLLIETIKNEVFRITIPSTWKVTFGNLHGHPNEHGERGKYLRIYESKDQQRAAFEGVRRFRDLSIKMEKLAMDDNKPLHWERDLMPGNRLSRAQDDEVSDLEQRVRELMEVPDKENGPAFSRIGPARTRTARLVLHEDDDEDDDGEDIPF